MRIRNIDEWQLFHLAQALTRAKRLEKLRIDFHEELYSCIIYPSVQLDQLEVRGNNPATDSQAIRIIEAKERYERKIHKEYDRSVRWKELLKWVDGNDKLIMIRYFEKKKSVRPEIISRLLSQIEKHLDLEERRFEQQRTEQSTTDFKKYQEQTQSFRKPIATTVGEEFDKIQYLISGQFIYMTPEEYADHLQQSMVF
ncbi:hypothetical protein [Sporosarcina sp. FA9]|uniref:hypothetical protein n=1 Tax=Sporosarcina sp. FA9 TaxID=3413030 RepID=UPI003F658B55